MATTPRPYRLSDGLGERHILVDPIHGFLEVLELAPELAGVPGVERLIEERASRMNAVPDGVVARVRGLRRKGGRVLVTADLPRGIRLSTLVAFMASCPGRVADTTLLPIVEGLLGALAAIHRQGEGLVHGAVSPDHVILTPEGRVVLTDGALGPVLVALEYSRERLWSAFGLTLPAAASLPRFDQRGDVTQLAGVVLALAVGRRLTDADFPRSVPELLASIMSPAEPAKLELASQFRAWLQRALQLPSRGVFSSGVDAEQLFQQLPGAAARQNGTQVLRALVRELTVPGAGTQQDLVGYSRPA